MTTTLTTELPELTEAQLQEQEAGYIITRDRLDALENAQTVPDVTEAELSEAELSEAELSEAELSEDTPEGACAAQECAEGQGGASEDAFVPDTKEKADWVLSKIADARGRAARIREHAEVMARQAEQEAAHLEWKYGPALQDLARRELTGRLKTLTLYHGQIGFRKKPAAVQITDTGAALAWAKVNLPEAVTEGIDRKAVAAAVKGLREGTGEVLDFAAFADAEETFFIK